MQHARRLSQSQQPLIARTFPLTKGHRKMVLSHVSHPSSTPAELMAWEEALKGDQEPGFNFHATTLGTEGSCCSSTRREQQDWESILESKEAAKPGATCVCAIVLGAHSIGMAVSENGKELARTYHDTLLAHSNIQEVSFGSASWLSTNLALGRCANELRKYSNGISSIRVVGTAAFRTPLQHDENDRAVANQALQQLIAPLSGLCNASLEARVISAAEEGRLAFVAATSDYARGQPCVVVDLGGASTEVAVGHAGQVGPPDVLSLPMGCLTSKEDLRSHLEQLRRFLTHHAFAPSDVPQTILAGGTATTAAALLQGLAHYDGSIVQGTQVSVEGLLNLSHALCNDLGSAQGFPSCGETSRAELEVSGIEGSAAKCQWLTDDRRRSLPVGCLVLSEILRCCGSGKATVSNRDLLDAILVDAM